MKYLTFLFSLAFLSLQPSLSSAQTITFSSGENQVALIELYTSEGCSSCPPAERWFSKLKQDPQLWKKVIPVAFHVDYWNSLGWKDRFSNKHFTQRQQRYVQIKNLSGVYTPGIMLAGQEWRSWYRYNALPQLPTSKAGQLNIKLNNKMLSAHYQPLKNLKHPQLNIALLGFELETDVKSGENQGKKLKHDFVALTQQKVLMQKSDNSWVANITIQPAKITAPRYGLAIWVDTKNNPTPIQATGGWLPTSYE